MVRVVTVRTLGNARRVCLDYFVTETYRKIEFKNLALKIYVVTLLIDYETSKL